MRKIITSTLASLAIVAALAGCGGGSNVVPVPKRPGPHTPSPSPAPTATPNGSASFSITVPSASTLAAQSQGTRRPLYVSPNTHSASISLTAVNGNASGGMRVAAALSPTANGCVAQSAGAFTCSISMTVPAAYDTFTISTYASNDATGPVLSTSTVTQAVSPNAKISVPFSLGGVVSSIKLSPSTIHTVQGSTVSSYLVSLTAVDASGATIVGTTPFQSPISISIQNDPNHALLVSESTVSAPGVPFQLRYDSSKPLADGQVVASAGTLGSAKADVIPLSFSPTTLSMQMGTAPQHITVSEVGFTGQFTATTDDANVATATVQPNGAGSATINLTPAALGGSSGKVTLTVSDGTLSGTADVTVTAPPLSGITYYPMNSSAFSPFFMTLAPNGDIYMTAQSAILEFNPTTHALSSYSVGSFGFGVPTGIAADASGNIWFGMNNYPAELCEMTMPSHAMACYTNGLQSSSQIFGVASASDGGIWFTDESYGSPAIGRMDPATHTAVEYTAGLSSASSPYDIVDGKDGNLYFSDPAIPAFGAISMSTHVISEYPNGLAPYNPQTQQSSSPYFITMGSDGNVWAADSGMPSMDQFVVSQQRTVQHLNGIERDGGPTVLADVPGSGIWFVDAAYFAPVLVGKTDPATGFTQEYSGLPSNATFEISGVVTTGPNDLWFADQGAGAMVHVAIP